ncbi:9221_t:CDS:1, partial [Cetraspora pellucida]
MIKEKLQKEILEKVKPGTKPSDLKKKRGNTTQFTHGIPTPPPSPILQPTKTNNLKELQQQVQFHAREAQNYLS